MTANQFYLGRQAIIGRNHELVAYELLFRSSTDNTATLLDDVAASAAVIQYAFSDLGIQKVLGEKRGFINLSETLLMSNVIEALPPDMVVLEILETVPLTPRVIDRCQHLKELGYRLALDDIIEFAEGYEAILPLINVVKVDVLAISQAKVVEIQHKLRPFACTLLAEKVNTQEQFAFCRNLGFDLFQGFFFEKPTILSGKSIQPSNMVLLNLLSLVMSDAETHQLDDALKQAPDITLNLLKLINSAAFRSLSKISTVREVIIKLGRIQLGRWIQIMVFAQQSGNNPSSGTLVHMAAARGHFMEGLAKALGWAELKDRAFMVGMLSLMDVLFNQPLVEILSLLNLDDQLQAALLNYEEKLGVLLSLAEAIEHGENDVVHTLMERLGLTDYDQLNRLQIEAIYWADSLSAL
jgi:EAL and modified HD-GYP domain-containing signal transduction protein